MSWQVYWWTGYGVFLAILLVAWYRKEKREKAERAELRRYMESDPGPHIRNLPEEDECCPVCRCSPPTRVCRDGVCVKEAEDE